MWTLCLDSPSGYRRAHSPPLKKSVNWPQRFERDSVAQGLEAADRPAYDGLAVPLVEGVRAEIVVHRVRPAQNVVHGLEHVGPTAMSARCLPRRAANRRKTAARYMSVVAAAGAASTNALQRTGLPLRIGAGCALPPLSCWPGLKPAHDTNAAPWEPVAGPSRSPRE